MAKAADPPRDRVQEDAATARTLITPALLTELERRLHEYENAITWNTTCLSCSAVLDSSIRETFRREAAEAKLAAIAERCGHPDQLTGTQVLVDRDAILAIIGSEEGTRDGR